MKYTIIGGGIAGLYSAYILLTLYKINDIIIIEKEARLGGRIYTHRGLEMGAGRFSTNHTLLLELLDIFGLSKNIIKMRNNHQFKLILNNNDYTIKTNISKILSKFNNNDLIKHKDTLLSHFLYKKIGKLETELLISMSGYDRRFYNSNTYEGIKSLVSDFNEDNTFCFLKGGMNQLVEKMVEFLKKNGVKFSTSTIFIDYKNGIVITDKNSFHSDKIIFTLPSYLLQNIPYLNPIRSYLNNIESINICRIYAKFKSCWFKDIPKTTTNLSIRQFIPINCENGLAMVVYNDTDNAKKWLNYKKSGKLNAKIIKNLSKLFPDRIISNIEWTEFIYWECGSHTWLPNATYNEYKNLLYKYNIYGEVLTSNQGWVEGALISVKNNLCI
jgi:protoporphyrinogen oxidase